MRKPVKLPGLARGVNRRSPLSNWFPPQVERRIASLPGGRAGTRRRLADLVLVVLAVLGPGVPLRTAAAQDESRRVVRGLRFEGNHALGAQTLERAIGTTNSSWFARAWPVRWIGLGQKRYFDETEFRRDVLRLQVLYKRSGFPDVQVDTLVRRTDHDVFLTFRITEGRPILVDSLEITGLDSVPRWVRRAALVDLPLRQGDVFNRYLMQATADSITQRLQNRGYPGATVYTSFESTREGYRAHVTLDVQPGHPAVFGAVRVEGTRRLDPAVARDLLVARPGRRYSEDELIQSQRNLYKSDLVRSATVAIDSADYQPGQDSVPLVVRLSESPPYRVTASTGYATTECFRAAAAWTARNFLGRGRLFELSGQASRLGVGRPFDFGAERNICSASAEDTIGSAKFNYQLSATVRRPAFLSPNNALALSLFGERRSEFKVYLRQDVGASVEFTHETPRRRMPLSLTYSLSYGSTEATAASFCAFFNACTPDVIDQLRQRRLLAALTARARRQRTNSPIDPSRGYNTTFEVTYASKLIGSSPLQQFTRLLADAAWYRPLGRDVVLTWRLRGGLIFSPTVAVGSQTNAFVPPEQRFYAGGPNDVRGFPRNELGPIVYVVSQSALQAAGSVDALSPDSVQVAPTGGNTLVVANVELRLPSPVFPSRTRLAAFVDAGSLWERGRTDLVPARLRITPGVGVRVGTPLGPARLDVAYNPYLLPPGALYQTDPAGGLTLVQDRFQLRQGRRFTFQFSVGQPF